LRQCATRSLRKTRLKGKECFSKGIFDLRKFPFLLTPFPSTGNKGAAKTTIVKRLKSACACKKRRIALVRLERFDETILGSLSARVLPCANRLGGRADSFGTRRRRTTDRADARRSGSLRESTSPSARTKTKKRSSKSSFQANQGSYASATPSRSTSRNSTACGSSRGTKSRKRPRSSHRAASTQSTPFYDRIARAER